MAVSIESFLVLEKSLAKRLLNSWRRDSAGVLREITELVQSGDFGAAEDLCAKLGMQGVAERNRKFAEFIGMQSVLFGASVLSDGDPKKTSFKTRPKQVRQASRSLMTSLSVNASDGIARKAAIAIAREREKQQEETVKRSKAATEGFVLDFVSNVNRNGKAFVDIGSSLHTSRLASWGFTAEAEARGWTEYQISEQLDGRTCPVCRLMHGKEFRVDAAKKKLEMQLSVDDPNDLKSIAPWPSQSDTNLLKMQSLSNSELQDRGYDTPPYHPMCRGVLRKSGTVTTVDMPSSFSMRVSQLIDTYNNAKDKYDKAKQIYDIAMKLNEQVAEWTGFDLRDEAEVLLGELIEKLNAKLATGGSLMPDVEANLAKLLEEVKGYGFLAGDESSVWLQRFYGRSPNELVRDLEDVLDKSDVYIALNSQTLVNDVIPNNKFKNSLETGVGTFEVTGADRVGYERVLFGIDADLKDVDAFPKYGFLGASTGPGERILMWDYGDTYVRLKKSTVGDRTTITLGDSLNQNKYSDDMLGMKQGLKRGDRVQFQSSKMDEPKWATIVDPNPPRDNFYHEMGITVMWDDGVEELISANIAVVHTVPGGVRRDWQHFSPAVRLDSPKAEFFLGHHDTLRPTDFKNLVFSDVDELSKLKEYVEAQIFGKVDLDDIDEIFISAKAEARQLRKMLDDAGYQHITISPNALDPWMLKLKKYDPMDYETAIRFHSMNAFDIDNLSDELLLSVAHRWRARVIAADEAGVQGIQELFKGGWELNPPFMWAGADWIRVPDNARKWLKAVYAEVQKGEAGKFSKYRMLWAEHDATRVGWTANRWKAGEDLSLEKWYGWKDEIADEMLVKHGLDIRWGGASALDSRGHGVPDYLIDPLDKVVDQAVDVDKARLWQKWFAELSPEDIHKSFSGGLTEETKLAVEVLRDNPVAVIRITDESVEYAVDLIGPNGGVIGRLELDLIDQPFVPPVPGKARRIMVAKTMYLASDQQGKGMAKHVFRSALETARALGIERVNINAAMEMGGYAWAKYGFIPTSNSWDALRNGVLRKQLKQYRKMLNDTDLTTEAIRLDVAARADVLDQIESILDMDNTAFPPPIWRLADIRAFDYGKSFLSGTSWDGDFTFRNVDAMARLRAYLGEGG